MFTENDFKGMVNSAKVFAVAIGFLLFMLGCCCGTFGNLAITITLKMMGY